MEFTAFLFVSTTNNFQITALVCVLVSLPGVITWLIANKTIIKDVRSIEKILEIRPTKIMQKKE